MLRFRPIKDAKAAGTYYGKSDGGYYLDSSELRREVGGNAAKLLGLEQTPDFEQFKRLLQGLDPHDGDKLTAKLVKGRLAGWDVTACVPKGVTIAMQAGDSRVHDALWQAGREAMADLEAMVTTRVRKGAEQDDRVTSNMIWYGFEHPETRPAKEDGMPAPDRHIHFVIPNVTWDAREQEWKAIKFRPIMDMRKFFDRRFDMRLASKLTDLGYEIETKYRPDPRGGKRYYSWDIKGMPPSVVQKFSRRTGEVEKLAADLGIENPVSKDKLGATSRSRKLVGMTFEDYRKYWNSRITGEEGKRIAAAINDAVHGKNPKPTNTADKGMAYAIGHMFERQSVVNWTDLAIAAMERCMGGAKPEQFEPEARKQGVLFKDGQVTTQAVLEEERRVIAFARDGRGTCRPMGRPRTGIEPAVSNRNRTDHCDAHTATATKPLGRTDLATLSPEQQAICRHVWDSPDRVILIRGGAGTGKTHTMKTAIAGINRPVAVLAPSAEASRGVLRRDGFKDADTVAAFLGSEQAQEKARNGVIWVDEAGLLGIRQVSSLFETADRLNARVVLQGDRKQHGSVERGATLRVLQEFAGLPVAELTDIRRQRGDYKKAVAAIAKGRLDQGFEALDKLGWVKQAEGNAPLVSEYMAGLAAGKDMLVVAPTHAEGNEITAEIRARLKEKGIVGQDEQVFETLTPTGWTEAERGDPTRYTGDEVVQFVRNSGEHRAGDRVASVDFDPAESPAKHFAAYLRGQTALAAGDTIRITANGKTADGHRLNNGSLYTIKGFDKDGGIVLGNGWVVGKDFGHFTHGYVSTSHASQGKTVDRVLVAMGGESIPAINAQQFYVSVTRGREKAMIFTDLKPDTLREAIRRSDPRQTATELLHDKPKRTLKEKAVALLKNARGRIERLREIAAGAIRELERQKERDARGRA